MENRLSPSGLRSGGVVAAICFAFVAPTWGQDCVWNEYAITEPGAHATQVELAVDPANNAYGATVVDEELAFGVIGRGTILERVPGLDGGFEGDPGFGSNRLGTTSIAFTQVLLGEEAFGREVIFTQNVGGFFQPFQNVSDNRVDDYGLDMALDSQEQPHLVWAQRVGEGSRVLYWNPSLEDPEEVSADGDFPSVFVDTLGLVHVVYLRGNDVAYRNNAGGMFQFERPVTTSPLVPESTLSVAVDTRARVFVTYESNNSLYVSVKDGAQFGEQQPLDEGGVFDPHIDIDENDNVLLAYIKDGDVYSIQGQFDALDEPAPITNTPGIESGPTLERDGAGVLHVTYLRDGGAYYGNDACAPTAAFSATTTAGRAPFEVSFTDESLGDVLFWSWDFGDGATSTVRSPKHIYNKSGLFTVSLRVWGLGGLTDQVVKEQLVNITPALNSFRIRDHRFQPGETDVRIPIHGTLGQPSEGLQMMGTFDPTFLDLSRMELENTLFESEGLDPDFFLLNDEIFYFEVGILMETNDPFLGLTLPPVQDAPLVILVFDIPETAPRGETSRFDLVNDDNISEIENLVIVDGFNRPTAIVGGNISIASDPADAPFVRGETAGDGSLNIADAVGLLNFLFGGSSSITCLDAGDFDDNGRLNIADAISILNFLFGAGEPPEIPYPFPGLDPTDDDLGNCT